MNKKFFYIVWLIIFILSFQYRSLGARNLYGLTVKNIDGEEIKLENFRGKVLLIVNTASRCGFTNQYRSLEKVFKKYKSDGFYVLAFPSNDFRQELSSNEEIKGFCEGLNITFPIFSEGKVTGFEKQEIFRFLTENENGESIGEIRWNFEKFLVNRVGKLVKRFRSSLNPNKKNIIQAIESIL